MRTSAFIVLVVGAALLAAPVPSVHAGGCGGCPAGAAAKSECGAGGADLVDTAVSAGKFSTLVAAVKAAGLVDTLKGEGPFTVFAPSDEAFAKLPAGTVEGLLADKEALTSVLTYHVVAGALKAADVAGSTWLPTVNGQSLFVSVAGDEVRVDGARVVATDVMAKNGVIHVIDTVVLPRKDIVGVAAEAGVFKTLLAAAEAAGLVETLKGAGPFTVFAPTDEAFAKLPAGTVEGLLADTAKLKALLLHHVVAGRVLAPAKTGAGKMSALDGNPITVSRSDYGTVRVDEATVVKADVLAGNGVVHVIDTVLLPR
jgi:transforming growth factor-beta-induced protein